jgi:hypothetical protein
METVTKVAENKSLQVYLYRTEANSQFGSAVGPWNVWTS